MRINVWPTSALRCHRRRSRSATTCRSDSLGSETVRVEPAGQHDRHMIAAVGTLEGVDMVLKVLGMVNAVPDFTQHPEVINGCTDLQVQV